MLIMCRTQMRARSRRKPLLHLPGRPRTRFRALPGHLRMPQMGRVHDTTESRAKLLQNNLNKTTEAYKKVF